MDSNIKSRRRRPKPPKPFLVWRKPTTEEFRKSGISGDIDKFIINSETFEIVWDFRHAEAIPKPKRGKANRRKRSLHDLRREQLANPTRAGNAFAAIAKRYFPRNYVLREVIKRFYLLDFLFPASNLCVEIDGPYHQYRKQKSHDENRTEYLFKALGIKVVRFTNQQVLKNPESVISELKRFLP